MPYILDLVRCATTMADMDQVIATAELEYPPAKAAAKELGHDREAIAFLGMSCLKGVGFQTLSGLGGRAGISKLLDERNVSEVARQIAGGQGYRRMGGLPPKNMGLRAGDHADTYSPQGAVSVC